MEVEGCSLSLDVEGEGERSIDFSSLFSSTFFSVDFEAVSLADSVVVPSLFFSFSSFSFSNSLSLSLSFSFSVSISFSFAKLVPRAINPRLIFLSIPEEEFFGVTFQRGDTIWEESLYSFTFAIPL